MCNSKTLKLKLLLFKAGSWTTPLPPSNCSLCCLRPFQPRIFILVVPLAKKTRENPVMNFHEKWSHFVPWCIGLVHYWCLWWTILSHFFGVKAVKAVLQSPKNSIVEKWNERLSSRTPQDYWFFLLIASISKLGILKDTAFLFVTYIWKIDTTPLRRAPKKNSASVWNWGEHWTQNTVKIATTQKESKSKAILHSVWNSRKNSQFTFFKTFWKMGVCAINKNNEKCE